MRIFPGLRAAILAALILVLATAVQGATSPYAATLRGTVVDASGLPLPGVELTLVRRGLPPFVFLTDLDGKYAVRVPPGRYEFRAALSGFESFSTTVDLADGSPLVCNVVLVPAGIQEQVQVVAADAPAVLGTTAAEPAALGRTVIDNATLPHNRFEDVLPLLPGVVRGPDGLISVAGARAPQGSLLVNGLGETDPVTGEFASTLPLAAVEKLEVYATSTAAEYGNAVGGITQVTTRSGGDAWHFSINSVDPRPHIVRGWIRSIDAWEPNGGIRGPVVHGRAWVAQSFDYRYQRTWFDTVVGRQPTRINGLASLTQLDTQIKVGHLLSTLFSVYPETTDHAALNAFTPASTTPDLHTGGWSATLIDRLALGDNAALESRAQVKRLDLTLTPENTDPYVVAHDLVHGGYFNTQNRTSSRAALNERYSRTVHASVDHDIAIGGSVSYTTTSGRSTSLPVVFLRSDGTLARIVDFAGDGNLSATAYQFALFAQDGLALTRSLRLDVGVRFDTTTLAHSPRLSPRLGWSYAFPDGSTTFSGNAGIYADKLVLGAATFPMQQDRLVTIFDAAGSEPLSRVSYHNVTGGDLRPPVASAWSLQIDRRFARGWMARLKYQERHGRDEPVVAPILRSPAGGDMVLESSGQSRSRSVELTVGRRFADGETYVSYVRSASRGNLNDLNSIEGNYRLALVQPDMIAPLGVDVPNRLLAWAVVRLPWRITVAPFFELRNGFPYSAIDDDWNEPAPRNSRRFPPFASLDLVGSKIVKLPFGLPDARIGLKLFNVTGRFNGRDIQRDVERLDFGTTYNPGRRTLRGIFEVIWSPGSDDDRRH